MISFLEEDDAHEVIRMLLDLARSDPNVKRHILNILHKDVTQVNKTKGYKNAEKLSTLHITIKLIEGNGQLDEHTSREVAESQNISETTMSNYLKQLYKKIAGIEGLLEEIVELTQQPFPINKSKN